VELLDRNLVRELPIDYLGNHVSRVLSLDFGTDAKLWKHHYSGKGLGRKNVISGINIVKVGLFTDI
jgi:hypothetical protein